MARAPRIDKLVDAWDPILRKAFLDSIYAMRDRAQVNLIAERLQAGDVEGALRAVSLDPVAFRAFDKALLDAYEAGGNITAGALPTVAMPDGYRVKFQFNVRNPAAEQWLNEHSSTLIREIVDDQRNMVREYMRAGLAAGNNPRTIALDIAGRVGPTGKREGGVIGLTESQSQWVRNYAAELASDNPRDALSRSLRDARFDKAVERYAAAGEPIPVEMQAKMVDAYENRAIRYRAEAIARTEAMAALHEAQQQAMEQALETGAVAPEAVTFIWRATQDDRTRDSHAVMDGQEVAMGEMFITGDGNQLEYPGDPNGPPEEIINCLPGDTVVLAKDIERVYRRWYDGELIDIVTASGKNFSVTPNHPVLTPKGLVAASFINEGDDLIGGNFADFISYINDVPTVIEQLFDTLSCTQIPVRTISVAKDFHGDGINGYVDIISTERFLVNWKKSFEPKNFEHMQFSFAKKVIRFLSSVRTFRKVLLSSFAAPYSIVGSNGLFGSLMLGHFGPFEKFSFAPTSDDDVVLQKYGTNLKSADTAFVRNGFFRKSVVVKSNDLVTNLGPLLSTKSNDTCPVGAREIITKISRRRYSGHVYNLQTRTGHYIAQGIVQGNCRCWREPNVDFLAGLE